MLLLLLLLLLLELRDVLDEVVSVTWPSVIRAHCCTCGC